MHQVLCLSSFPKAVLKGFKPFPISNSLSFLHFEILYPIVADIPFVFYLDEKVTSSFNAIKTPSRLKNFILRSISFKSSGKIIHQLLIIFSKSFFLFFKKKLHKTNFSTPKESVTIWMKIEYSMKAAKKVHKSQNLFVNSTLRQTLMGFKNHPNMKLFILCAKSDTKLLLEKSFRKRFLIFSTSTITISPLSVKNLKEM